MTRARGRRHPTDSRQRATRSAAAAGHSGNSKAKPASSRRPGRRGGSSESARCRCAGRTRRSPPSTVVAGRPMRTPHAARSAAMNSRWGSGFGAARLTAPADVVALDQQLRPRARSRARGSTTRTAARPRCVPPRPRRVRPEQHVEDAAAVGAHHHRRAQRDLARARRRAPRSSAASHALAMSMLNAPVRGRVRLVAADACRSPRRWARRSGARRSSPCSSAARRAAAARRARSPGRRRASSRRASSSSPSRFGVRVAAVDAAPGQVDDDVGAVDARPPTAPSVRPSHAHAAAVAAAGAAERPRRRGRRRGARAASRPSDLAACRRG